MTDGRVAFGPVDGGQDMDDCCLRCLLARRVCRLGTVSGCGISSSASVSKTSGEARAVGSGIRRGWVASATTAVVLEVEVESTSPAGSEEVD